MSERASEPMPAAAPDPHSPTSLMELTNRLRMFAWAVASVPAASITLVLFILSAVGAALVSVWVGIPLLFVTIALTRPIADLYRRLAGGLVGQPLASPYLRPRPGGWVVRLRGWVVDPATRRDLLWLLVNGTIGLVLSCIAIAETVLDLIFWWLPSSIAVRLHASIAVALLAPSEKSRLAQRVEQLKESRAETVDTQAAELRRIERDLHDGAQARLVAIGMSLGLAEEQLDSNPELARSLLSEARDTASVALADLRDLVRGVHPPVLAERGFVEAVRSLASALPIPVEVRTSLGGRLPAPVESAAYFAIAEVLANVIKHAQAQHVVVELAQGAETLELRVTDDGVGGADPARGTGLRGIARRLAAFDGDLTVDSPAGGPTAVVMVLACQPSASSSAKTSPSSATD